MWYQVSNYNVDTDTTLGISTDELADGRITFIPRAGENRFTSLEEIVTFCYMQMREGKMTFEGVPLDEDEAQYMHDAIAVNIEILKKKRARQE